MSCSTFNVETNGETNTKGSRVEVGAGHGEGEGMDGGENHNNKLFSE